MGAGLIPVLPAGRMAGVGGRAEQHDSSWTAAHPTAHPIVYPGVLPGWVLRLKLGFESEVLLEQFCPLPPP